MKTVLVVEDEPQIREIAASYLVKAGFAVLEAGDGRTGLAEFTRHRPDLIVLDLMLPDLSGEEVCVQVRRQSSVPILMLTAKVTEDDKLRGFRHGADDYLTKPFSPRELVVRVQAILRRTAPTAPPGSSSGATLRRSADGRVVLDAQAYTAQKNGLALDLTPTEFRLLEAFLAHPGQVLTRERLVALALGDDFSGSDRTVDAHIKNLRLKVEDHPHQPRRIETVTGLGYRWALGAP